MLMTKVVNHTILFFGLWSGTKSILEHIAVFDRDQMLYLKDKAQAYHGA